MSVGHALPELGRASSLPLACLQPANSSSLMRPAARCRRALPQDVLGAAACAARRQARARTACMICSGGSERQVTGISFRSPYFRLQKFMPTLFLLLPPPPQMRRRRRHRLDCNVPPSLHVKSRKLHHARMKLYPS